VEDLPVSRRKSSGNSQGLHESEGLVVSSFNKPIGGFYMPIDAPAGSGQPVTADNGELRAGFLIYSDQKRDKDYALFNILQDGNAVFSREPTKEEKKRLKKLVYGSMSLRSVKTPLQRSEWDCEIFFYH
jgi:hypothetical protein